MKVLTRKTGLVWNSSLQTGHLYWTMSSQNTVIQALQKLCPHGVVTGLLNTSRQTEQEKSSSDHDAAEAIPRKPLLNKVQSFMMYNNGKIEVVANQ